MNVWRLVLRELLHRKLNFALGVVSVAMAVAVVTAAFTLLRAHDVRTDEMLAAKHAAAHARLAKLEDDYRKYMKELGFNLLILPKDQELSTFWTKGYAEHTMPEEYVHKLANSRTMIIRHLLPIVQQKVQWPEKQRQVTLIGTRGEVPLAHRRPKEPMLLAVPEGKIVVGYALARDLDLEPGDEITLRGRAYTVHKTRGETGSAEDATMWVDLAAAQKLLDMEGRINGIEALKCHCKDVGIPALKEEISRILDQDVNVVARENKVTLRAKARDRVAAEHRQAIAAEVASRARLRQTREGFAAVLVPVVLLASAVWIGLLALVNVRERTGEIGILRAIGVRSASIFAVFLVKALLIGVIGAAAGYAAGLGGSILAAGAVSSLAVSDPAALFAPLLLIAVIPAAPVLSALASWAPATLAARQDPALILAKE